MSPLSKKMAIHSAALKSNQKQQGQFNQPFFVGQQTMTSKTVTAAKNLPVLPNEFKVLIYFLLYIQNPLKFNIFSWMMMIQKPESISYCMKL